MRRHAVFIGCPLRAANSALQLRSLESTSSVRMCVSRIWFNVVRPEDAKRKLPSCSAGSVTFKPMPAKKSTTSVSVSSYKSLRGRASNRSKALFVAANSVSFPRPWATCKFRFRMPSGISRLGTTGTGRLPISGSNLDASKPGTARNSLKLIKMLLFKMANSAGDALIKIQRVPNKVSFSSAQINSAIGAQKL